MPRPFHPFTPEHYLALALGILATSLLIHIGRRGGTGKNCATALLAFINLSVYPLSQAAWLSLAVPKSVDNFVPLHLCDIAAMTAGFALITKRPLLCTLTYFWGLAATVQALITPAITVGYPHPPFIMFSSTTLQWSPRHSTSLGSRAGGPSCRYGRHRSKSLHGRSSTSPSP